MHFTSTERALILLTLLFLALALLAVYVLSQSPVDSPSSPHPLAFNQPAWSYAPSLGEANPNNWPGTAYEQSEVR